MEICSWVGKFLCVRIKTQFVQWFMGVALLDGGNCLVFYTREGLPRFLCKSH